MKPHLKIVPNPDDVGSNPTPSEYKKDTMKIEVVLKPCPWCKKTPDIWMPIEEATWCWEIRCINQHCEMRPKTPYVSIRKSNKENFILFHEKLCVLVHRWNHGLHTKPYEMKVIDLTKIATNKSWDLPNLDPWFARIHAAE